MLSKLTRRHNNPLASVASGNHIAADLSQSLAEQIRPSVDLAAQASSSFSATPAIANMSALSQTWRNPLLPAQSSIADMIKRLTGTGSMPKLSDQLAATIPSSIMPEPYRGGVAARFAKAYDAGSTSKQAIKALTKIDMPPLVPTTTVPKFDRIYFTPAIDFASIFSGALPATDLSFNQQINVSDVLRETRQQLANLFKRLNIEDYRNAISSSSKWTDSALEHCDHSLLEGLLLDEGLALLWVVEPELRVQIFSAQSKFARLHILSDHQEFIVDHCCELLEDIDQPDLAEWRDFAVEVASALRGGYTAAAQALAVNLIDTMLIENFTYQGKGQKMSHGTRRHSTRFNIDAEKEIEQGIVYGGLWGMFLQFHSDSEDAIPHQLSRHATAHAVSKRQYRRVNSLIAFMHAVDYLCLWQEGKAEKAKAA